jgi:hypothetical protein
MFSDNGAHEGCRESSPHLRYCATLGATILTDVLSMGVYVAKPMKKKLLNRFGRKSHDMQISGTPVRMRGFSPRGVYIE